MTCFRIRQDWGSCVLRGRPHFATAGTPLAEHGIVCHRGLRQALHAPRAPLLGDLDATRVAVRARVMTPGSFQRAASSDGSRQQLRWCQ